MYYSVCAHVSLYNYRFSSGVKGTLSRTKKKVQSLAQLCVPAVVVEKLVRDHILVVGPARV